MVTQNRNAVQTQNRNAVVTQNQETSKPQSRQTQNGVNKLTKLLKWNENGGELKVKNENQNKPNLKTKMKWSKCSYQPLWWRKSEMELNEDEMEVANEEESRRNSAGRRREKLRKHKSESENALGG